MFSNDWELHLPISYLHRLNNLSYTKSKRVLTKTNRIFCAMGDVNVARKYGMKEINKGMNGNPSATQSTRESITIESDIQNIPPT